jgi:hypothetical protein
MIWLFLTVVLLLVVLHPGFRRVMGWLASGAVVVIAATFAVIWWRDAHRMPDTPTPNYFDRSSPGPPIAGQVVPCADLPENLRARSNCAVPTCPAGQTPAKDNLTGAQSCYDPHDPAQLTEHLKECRGDSTEWGRAHPNDTVVADRRNIPCNVYDQVDGAHK